VKHWVHCKIDVASPPPN